MPPLKQALYTETNPNNQSCTSIMRHNQIYTGGMRTNNTYEENKQQNEATFKVNKMNNKSGFGDFYNNVKHFERPSPFDSENQVIQ